MTKPVSVRVIGICASQGSKRHVGNGIMIESSKKVKPWRDDVRAALLVKGEPIARFEGAVSAHFEFLMKRPQRLAKKNEPCVSPLDLDKMIRATMDAITSSGVWRDDAQVTDITASKRYVEQEEPTGCFIHLSDPFPEFTKKQPKGKPDVKKDAAAGPKPARKRAAAGRSDLGSGEGIRRGPIPTKRRGNGKQKLGGTDFFV